METALFTELVEKGRAGEQLIRNYFIDKDYAVTDWLCECPHPVDCFVWRKDKGLAAVEIKSYPSRIYYNDTGVDQADYRTYVSLSKKLPVWLFFIDSRQGSIYFSRIKDLKGKGKPQGTKIYFELNLFKMLRKLSKEEIRAIEMVQ